MKLHSRYCCFHFEYSKNIDVDATMMLHETMWVVPIRLMGSIDPSLCGGGGLG